MTIMMPLISWCLSCHQPLKQPLRVGSRPQMVLSSWRFPWAAKAESHCAKHKDISVWFLPSLWITQTSKWAKSLFLKGQKQSKHIFLCAFTAWISWHLLPIIGRTGDNVLSKNWVAAQTKSSEWQNYKQGAVGSLYSPTAGENLDLWSSCR